MTILGTVIKNIMLLSCIQFIIPLTANAQCEVCNDLKINVVRITTSFEDGTDENGFGIIIAEGENKLYVITANHVVASSDGTAVTIMAVYFFEQEHQGYQASPVKYNETLDLALIEVTKPGWRTWNNAFIDSESEEGVEVWYIGRSEKWYIPFSNGYLHDISKSTRKLTLEMPGVQKGCSGAPIVTKKGIIGIITDDSPGDVSGMHINLIRDLVQDDWNRPFQGENFKEKTIQEIPKKMEANETENPNWLTDPRDGQIYRTVTIGGKVWMATNLNYTTASGSWCYNNQEYNCKAYGRLYKWGYAKYACPEGWHTPSKYEWKIFIDNFGGFGNTETTTNLRENGFTIFPGGKYMQEEFLQLSQIAVIWSSTLAEPKYELNAWVVEYSFGNKIISLIKMNAHSGASVRCLKD